jgi:hypothetical protein
MKMSSVGAEFHADRRTDRHDENLIVAFRNFANAPKKSSPVHAIKAHSRRRGIAPLIRNLNTRRRRVVKSTPRTSKALWQKTRCPVNWGIGGSRKKSLTVSGIRIPNRSGRSRVATPTTLKVLRVRMARFKSAYTVSQNTTMETSNDPQGSYEQISHPYGKKMF